MILILNVSFKMPLLKNQPVMYEDFKCFDDLDVECKFQNAFLEDETRDVERCYID